MPYVSEELRAARIASTATLLISLDPAWTVRSVSGLDSDREPSLIIVGQMLEGLAILQSEQEFLAEVAEVLDAATIKQVMVKSELSASVQRTLAPLLSPAQVKKQSAALPESLADERTQLIAQAATLRAGRAAAGDMSRRGKCALGWVMLAAGAALKAWPLGAAGGLLIAENCGAVA